MTMRAVIYARYSTDQQREQSLEDQVRVCERVAERNGFTIVERFSDAAISGGTAQRPAYQSMLASARRREFDIIIAEDMKRLWREQAEQWRALKELQDLSIDVVTAAGTDSRLPGFELIAAVMGAAAEMDRKETGYRTRRGLEGRARAGAPSGGRAYGYMAAKDAPSGRTEINDAQAAIVREIFTRYADGESALAIAQDLNRRGVPSPGSTWNLTRRTHWSASAINGDPKTGAGILNTDTYVGRKVWGRTKRVRSAMDSKRRKTVVQPESEWIVTAVPELRIVPDELWRRVKARQAEQRAAIGERVASGLARAKASRTGRRPTYAFSGILRCGDCGSRLTMVDARAYQCAGWLNGRSCENATRFRRRDLQLRLVAAAQEDLDAPDIEQEFRTLVAAALAEERGRKPASDAKKRIAALEREVANLTDAVASGLLRASPALASRLRTAEDELGRLRAAEDDSARPKVAQLVPAVLRSFRAQLRRLPDLIENDPQGAREAVKVWAGDSIPVVRSEDGAGWDALIGWGIQQVARAVGLPECVAPRTGVGTFRRRVRVL